MITEDNKWGWQATEVRSLDAKSSWPGYVMHSSASPKNPESLCRWGLYKVNAFTVVIAMNGVIFGYDKSGLTVKAQQRVERVTAAMGHQPVDVENGNGKQAAPKRRGRKIKS